MWASLSETLNRGAACFHHGTASGRAELSSSCSSLLFSMTCTISRVVIWWAKGLGFGGRHTYSKMGEVRDKAKEGRRAKMREKRGKIVPFHFDRFLLHMIDTMCL